MPMRRRRKSDPTPDALVVVTDDGVSLRCSVAAIGRGSEPRWAILTASGEQFVGPVVESDRSPDTVKRIINEWWAARSRK